MARRYEVLVKVVSQKGVCVNGHKVGDEWIIGAKTPGGICGGAFFLIAPRASVLECGGSFPWEADPDSTIVACPDPQNPILFELRRLYKEPSGKERG